MPLHAAWQFRFKHVRACLGFVAVALRAPIRFPVVAGSVAAGCVLNLSRCLKLLNVGYICRVVRLWVRVALIDCASKRLGQKVVHATNASLANKRQRTRTP